MSKPKRIRLKVASPCKVDWNQMTGDDAMRFCGSCSKNVYQLSAMTTAQIEALLAESPNVCGRFYQRQDGSVMTSDCAPGVVRRRRKIAIAGIGAGLMSTLGLAFASGGAPAPAKADIPCQSKQAANLEQLELLIRDILGGNQPVEPSMGAAAIEPTMGEPMIMGDIAIDPEPEAEPKMGKIQVAPDHGAIQGRLRVVK